MAVPTTSYSLGASFVDICFGIDVEAYSLIVNSGTLTMRGMSKGARVYLDAAAVVDAGGGIVTLAAAGNGLTIGDTIFIPKGVLTNYEGEYTIEAGSDADNINITATYVAETPAATAYVNGYRDATLPAGAAITVEDKAGAGQPLFKGKGVCVISLVGVR
jgi:hypothetical protein